MESSTHKQRVNELKSFLVSVGTPLEWLTSNEEIDLDELFRRLKESGRINEEVYTQLNKAIKTKKPSLKE